MPPGRLPQPKGTIVVYIMDVQTLDQAINNFGFEPLLDDTQFVFETSLLHTFISYMNACATRDAGQTSQAEAALATIVRERPDFVAPRFDLVRLHRGRGDLRAARSHIPELLRHGASDPDVHVIVGIVVGDSGDRTAEYAHFLRAIHLDVSRMSVLVDLAITSRQLGHWHVALGWLAEIQERVQTTGQGLPGPQALRFYENRALIHEHFGEWHDAAANWVECHLMSGDPFHQERAHRARAAAARGPQSSTGAI